MIVKKIYSTDLRSLHNYVLYSVGLLPCSQTIDLPEKTLQGQTLQLKSGSVSDEASKFYTIDAGQQFSVSGQPFHLQTGTFGTPLSIPNYSKLARLSLSIFND